MTRRRTAIAAGLALGATVLAAPLVSAAALASPAPVGPTSLAPGHALSVGDELRSRGGRFTLSVTAAGRARLTRAAHVVWQTPASQPGARLVLRHSGNLVLVHDGRTFWQSGTHGATRSVRLSVLGGAVTLSEPAGTVWTSALGNGCRAAAPAHEVRVDISSQHAWFCSHHRQVLSTPVTTGAVDRGDGTPTGRWRVYAKQRNTTLYPAAGGAYPVHFWMPYNGAYGMHDAPWQHFAYGSDKYREHGSHGCVHIPEAAMRLLYHWAPIGTTVSIRH